MKKLLTPLLFFVLPIFCLAQSQTITGKIVDKNTQEPLPYATIQVPKTLGGTIANENGLFQLKIDSREEQILVSYIGYQDFPLNLSNTQKEVLIEMSTSDVQLDEVIVRSKSPLQYIRAAIKNHPDNIGSSAYNTRGFFQEKSKLVNDNSGAYSKAEAVFISHFPNDGDTSNVNQNQLALYREETNGEFRSMLYDNKKIQRKMDKGNLEINRDYKPGEEPEEAEEKEDKGMTINIEDVTGGGPSQVLRISQNLLKMGFLQEKYFKKIDFTFGENSSFNNRDLIVIDFKTKRRIDNSHFDGSIYLDYENLAFVAIKFNQDVKVPFFVNALLTTLVGFTVDQLYQKITIQNQQHENVWYPKELVKLSEITLKQKGQLELISSQQLFNIEQINTAEPKIIPESFRFDSELDYPEQVFKIEGLGWDQVNVIK